MSSDNVFAFDRVRQIEMLIKEVGSLEECKRLGFIYTDEQGIQSLSTAGVGCLLYIITGHSKTLAEAFAAGWSAAMDLVEEESSPET